MHLGSVGPIETKRRWPPSGGRLIGFFKGLPGLEELVGQWQKNRDAVR